MNEVLILWKIYRKGEKNRYDGWICQDHWTGIWKTTNRITSGDQSKMTSI